jgi:hypothetical protein
MVSNNVQVVRVNLEEVVEDLFVLDILVDLYGGSLITS